MSILYFYDHYCVKRYAWRLDASISILSWFLAPSCPSNSYYTNCRPACSPTCEYLNGPPGCNDTQPCSQGCACNEGFVRKGRICVPIQQCGCVDSNGKKYQVCKCFKKKLCACVFFKVKAVTTDVFFPVW